MGRLQLLVEVLQRAHRMLTAEDQIKYEEEFSAYIKGHSGQYIYHLKGEETGKHLEKIGKLMWHLIEDLQENYEEEPVYKVLCRVFEEHFRVEEKSLKTKIGKELSASSLQSVDDLEATYRQKNNKSYKGYVANITETCDPENGMQLITKVQVAPNNMEDAEMLVEALPNLKERTEIETLYTDGGYGSSEADEILVKNDVEQIQTAIRGRNPSNEKLNLSDFKIKQSESGKPTWITCPQEQTVEVHAGSQKNGYVAHFDDQNCQACPFMEKCPVKRGKRDTRFHLRFTQNQLNVSQRRQRSMTHQKEGRNLRAAVEATVRQVKHQFPASKLPVRGRFRVACMMIGSAAMSNIRRIQGCLEARKKQEIETKTVENERKSRQDQDAGSFYLNLFSIIGDWIKVFLSQDVIFETSI
jgi:hypothetical protein